MFADIGKKVGDFFKPDVYRLQRTVKIEVVADKAKWSLENKLTKDNKIESELKASHDFGPETFTITTSNKDDPKFELKTKRFSNYFDLTASLKDPTLEVETKTVTNSKVNFLLKGTFGQDKDAQAKVEGSYVGFNNLILGLGVNVNVPLQGTPPALKAFTFGAQYSPNPDHIFAVTADNGWERLKFQTQYKLRENYTAYGQVTHCKNNDEWSVGLHNKLSDTSHLKLAVRHDYSGSILYNVDFPKSKANAQICYNHVLRNELSPSGSLEWKVTFSP